MLYRTVGLSSLAARTLWLMVLALLAWETLLTVPYTASVLSLLPRPLLMQMV